MLLIINTVNINQEEQPFLSNFEELETVFEFLNHIVREGNKLTSAELIESKRSIKLPVEIFDGVCLSPALDELESEWISMLTEPVQSRSQPSTESARWYQEKLHDYERYIIDLELMICSVDKRCKRADYSSAMQAETVIACYQPLLKRYGSQLSKAHLLRSLLLDRLQLA